MRVVRLLAVAAAVGGLYALGALLTFWYFNAPESGVLFFPPAGITVATLLITPRRTWPLWLAAVAIAEISVDLAHNQTVFMALGFAVANTVEPYVGARLCRIETRQRADTPRGFLVIYVLCAVVAGPAVGGLIGGSVAAIAGTGTLVPTAAKWWLGDALGVLVVATPVLAWTRRHLYNSPATLAEIFAIAVLAVAVVLVPAIFMHESFAYAVLPVIMIAALRGGPLAVGISGFGVAFSASWVVATGRANTLLSIRDTEHALIETQLFIAVTLLAALTLAVEVAERMRAERVLRHAETERIRAELLALQATIGERRRIVRETHDIVGHALNVMILSGGAARRVLDHDTAQARDLLATVEEVGRDAFRDLDVALGLADQSTDIGPLKGLGDLDELVERLVRAGMQVDVRVEGTPRTVPRLVDGSAYRILQESLTNVAKHGIAARTQIRIEYLPNALLLEVSDTGRRSNGNGNGNGNRNGNGKRNGHESETNARGLVGMRERVAVLGGRIEAGPLASGGYSVIAELPLEQA